MPGLEPDGLGKLGVVVHDIEDQLLADPASTLWRSLFAATTMLFVFADDWNAGMPTDMSKLSAQCMSNAHTAALTLGCLSSQTTGMPQSSHALGSACRWACARHSTSVCNEYARCIHNTRIQYA